LVANAGILSKVYFPRMFMPLSAVFAKLVDFGIASVFLFVLMAIYGIIPTIGILLMPFLVILMMLTAAGLGMLLAALAIQYRDIKHAMGFVIQLSMYATPVVYATSLIPERYQLLYAVNPMVGVIEGFRACLLNTRPMPWSFVAIGAASSLVVFIVGALFFRRKERLFADVA
jgi:lipopolysaccharide transport system permease protein